MISLFLFLATRANTVKQFTQIIVRFQIVIQKFSLTFELDDFVSGDKKAKPESGGGSGGSPKPPINNTDRPRRPGNGPGNDPNVNPEPNPTYKPPVYPEQYDNSPTKTGSDRPGYGDLGVRPIHAGGSTPSLNRSYESSQRESGTDDRFQGPNTSEV